MKNKNIYKRAVEMWGVDAQSDVMMEECAELIFAILKMKRSGTSQQITDRYNNVCEEIADVRLMLNQMEYIYDKNMIDDYYKEKKDGVIKKLENYEKDKNNKSD